MTTTRKENLLAQVTGATDVFTTNHPYEPGSLMIGYNGQVYANGENISLEILPLSFQLAFTPAIGTTSFHVIYESTDGAIDEMEASGFPPGC